MIKPLALTLLSALLWAPSTHAQAAPAATSTTQQVDALFARWDRPDSPGAAVAVL